MSIKKVLNHEEKLFRKFISHYSEGVVIYDLDKLIGFAYRKCIEAGEKGRKAKVSLDLLSGLELIVSSSNYNYPVQVENDLIKFIKKNFKPQWENEKY